MLRDELNFFCTQAALVAGPVQDHGAADQPLLLVRDGLVQRQHVEVPSLGTWLSASQVRHLRPVHERRMEGQSVLHPVLLHMQETSRYSCPRLSGGEGARASLTLTITQQVHSCPRLERRPRKYF